MLMVDKLVKEHNKTPDEVYLMNYIDALNWLSMYREKERYIEQLEKQKLNKI
jgi:sulfur relay (sulfurtransferase) DsrF/TusC family protein